ncbi:MAG: hypothetical protein WCK08_00455 [Betaproteobacteria bacterium]
MRRLHLLILSLIFTVASCASAPQEPPADTQSFAPTSCASACANAARLCGPDVLKPTNGTCSDVCNATEAGGGDFRTGCFSAAQSCAQVEVCSR